MTPTEKAKRAEALYYDNNNITRRTLCHMIANLESDLKDTRARNIKLQMRNATLRELVETFGMIANDRVLDYFERDEMLETANTTARELGVEI